MKNNHIDKRLIADILFSNLKNMKNKKNYLDYIKTKKTFIKIDKSWEKIMQEGWNEYKRLIKAGV